MIGPGRRARRDREQQRAQPLGAAQEEEQLLLSFFFSFSESWKGGRGDSDRELPRLPRRRGGRRRTRRKTRRRSGEPLSQGEDDRRRTGALSLVLLQGPSSKGLGALVDRRGDGAVPAGGEDEVVLAPEGLCDGVEGPDGSQQAAEEDGVEGACGGRERKRMRKKVEFFLLTSTTSTNDGRNKKKTTHCGLRLLLGAVLFPVVWRDRDAFHR